MCWDFKFSVTDQSGWSFTWLGFSPSNVFGPVSDSCRGERPMQQVGVNCGFGNSGGFWTSGRGWNGCFLIQTRDGTEGFCIFHHLLGKSFSNTLAQSPGSGFKGVPFNKMFKFYLTDMWNITQKTRILTTNYSPLCSPFRNISMFLDRETFPHCFYHARWCQTRHQLNQWSVPS